MTVQGPCLVQHLNECQPKAILSCREGKQTKPQNTTSNSNPKRGGLWARTSVISSCMGLLPLAGSHAKSCQTWLYLATSVASNLFKFSQRIPTDTQTCWSRDQFTRAGVAARCSVRNHLEERSFQFEVHGELWFIQKAPPFQTGRGASLHILSSHTCFHNSVITRVRNR